MGPTVDQGSKISKKFRFVPNSHHNHHHGGDNPYTHNTPITANNVVAGNLNSFSYRKNVDANLLHEPKIRDFDADYDRDDEEELDLEEQELEIKHLLDSQDPAVSPLR